MPSWIFIALLTAIATCSALPTQSADAQIILDLESSQHLCKPKHVEAYLKAIGKALGEAERTSSEAAWAYETNVTDENLAKLADADVAFSSFTLRVSRQAAKIAKDCDLSGPEYPSSIRRQIKLLQEMADDTPTTKKDQKRLAEVVGQMTSTYAKARVNGMFLDPDLTATLATSRNASELENVYVGWRNANKVSKKAFAEYVALENNAAIENGFKNMADVWRSVYEMPTSEFDALLLNALNEISPLYDQLHCYTYEKLRDFYGVDIVGDDGLIPGHLLGNMWAQDWANIYDILAPYPDVVSPTITPELIRRNFTAEMIHKLAESFYVSLGFDPLPSSFWSQSMIVRPEGREVVCHASAWDFGDDDLRIKMCTTITQEDVATVHHEQGHLNYDHHYRNLPYAFRGGANDGFHEAIGDTVVLSFQTPEHLRDDLGMLPPAEGGGESDYKALINYQLHVALEKIAVLPWTFLMDKWRWETFEGLPEEKWNLRWWELIKAHQGLKPPASLDITAPDSFDPACKYHISADVPYIRYFLAGIYQFQFHRALCAAAHPVSTPPLHECSIYGSKDAGQLFGAMLALGRSEPWQIAMSVVTQGKENTLNGTAVVDYFAPLLEWLKSQNAGKQCSWKSG
ncbi:zinc-dependent metallopeptidase [Gonapodya prolifera JEL478]|uniref:Angiotensin-converting enzyme n=1 Tax=Gonapodya prolifera (strain JEL478) TaxID=1344416 RepID=A0A138ZZB9_GONPJ|nr:zinc-dependent metallopeptidase [Gonapodya prolifera JEL478]|eukprot:KXS09615.1 zinc-dependent metallopeptidase [Gonapodya prolifera JEL478]